jgi:hypothetical protein
LKDHDIEDQLEEWLKKLQLERLKPALELKGVTSINNLRKQKPEVIESVRNKFLSVNLIVESRSK